MRTSTLMQTFHYNFNGCCPQDTCSGAIGRKNDLQIVRWRRKVPPDHTFLTKLLNSDSLPGKTSSGTSSKKADITKDDPCSWSPVGVSGRHCDAIHSAGLIRPKARSGSGSGSGAGGGAGCSRTSSPGTGPSNTMTSGRMCFTSKATFMPNGKTRRAKTAPLARNGVPALTFMSLIVTFCKR